jgi:alanyl-tRNA synthetase
MITHREIREKFLNFFEKRGHKIIPSASLVPENDPSVLFTTAGMQPLVPYLLGESHPEGNRLANIQKSIRTKDIEEVGDGVHLTFFEMMGNWSLGDYFKDDAIKWSYELLTSKEEGFGLNPDRLYITCFEGNRDASKDVESAKIWQSVGIPESRIFFMPAENNWWSPGDNGPSGPDTEIFYDLAPKGPDLDTKEDFIKADKVGRVVEIWNNVFMEFEKKEGKVVGNLSQQNVDTGAGLDRFAVVLQGKDNVYETDLFTEIMDKIEELAPHENKRSQRIIADHIRSAVFMIGDGVLPSNTDRGYILRRLLRRAVKNADLLGMSGGALVEIAHVVINDYGNLYKNLYESGKQIKEEIKKEEEKFRKTLEKGLKELEKLGNNVSGKDAFDLYQTYGFPIEMTEEIVKEKGGEVDLNSFNEELKKHSELSSTASAGKFKGGLAGEGVMETKYHTATHLLLASLQKVLGTDVEQRGSNITAERLRFDFSWPEKLTDDQRQQVEDLVNQKIEENLPVSFQEVTLDEAKKMGAHGIFDEKYGDKVKVYKIGPPLPEGFGEASEKVFSLEICGGPHVTNTGDLGEFKIKKEESSSSGIRRIKAVLE